MVVRGTGRLSDSTRERVRESMKTLGYVYHRGAANLRTRRSGVIGLLITDVSNPFFAAMTLGFEEAAAGGGYLTMMTNTFDDPERQAQLAQSMLEYPIEALAYSPVMGSDLARQLVEIPIPILAVTRKSSMGAPYLGADDLVGGLLAGEHLVEVHGYRRIAYLGGPNGAGPREERICGLEEVVARYPDAAIVANITSGKTNVAGGIRSAKELLESGIEFDAVLCHSDVIAFAVLSALRSRPFATPVGVIGFDGLSESELFWPPVTSVSVGPEAIGRQAAQWLLRELDGRQGETLVPITPHLDIRASCGCANPDA